MAKNKMEQVAKIFDKNLEEIFLIKFRQSTIHCKFTKGGIEILDSGYGWQSTKDCILRELLVGNIKEV